MKKIALILTIFTLFFATINNASAWCVFGLIGNTCGESSDEEFFPPTGQVVTEPIGEVIPVIEIDDTNQEQTNQEDDEITDGQNQLIVTDEEKASVDIVLEVVEGDLIDLNPVAIDPDGDEVNYEFSEPFSANGLWQTRRGDFGKYLVTVTATDGTLTTAQEALILVLEANKIPIIECPETIRVNEGEEVILDCNAYDPDGDSIILTYEGWMESNNKQTTFNDAGTYTTQITASDGENEIQTTVSVEVMNVNRPPVIEELDDVFATETEVVVITPEVEDPDGDEVEVEYSEPLNSEGVFRTRDGDSGTYTVTVTATDGKETAKETFQLTIDDINTAPVMDTIPDIVVDETETVRINVEAVDQEGDEITIIYEGWMDSDTKRTTYDDAGTYAVIVTATDGELSTSQEVQIVVRNKNRAPTFVIPA